ncbi:MAG: lasso RiPP family leader peptide-containing protein [Deltaproteobacteria bacterium]|nr:lasso RiPP family leader peptide-containing protein [Deltaproteobacteria bacterium]
MIIQKSSVEDATILSESTQENVAAGAEPEAWSSPRLSRLGDIRELTLGGSPGAGDSGNPTTFRAPGT